MQHTRQFAICALFSLFALFALPSCNSTKKNFDKIPQTPFITHYELNKNKTKPFLSYWENDEIPDPDAMAEILKKQKLSIYVKPVTLKYLAQTPVTKEYAKDIETLRQAFDQDLQAAFAKREKETSYFTLLKSPSSKACTLEVAIVAITPTPTKGNVLRQAVGAVESVGGLIISELEKKGSIAIAAKFTAPNGKLLAEIADYGQDQSSILGVDFKNFSHFAHHKLRIKGWSRQLAETFTSTRATKVKGAPLFTIDPF